MHRVGDIDQMGRDLFSGRKRVFPDVFAAADIESAVKLPGIDADDFAVQSVGKTDGKSGLSCGCRTGYDCDFNLFQKKKPFFFKKKR